MIEEIWRPVPISWLSEAFEVSNLGNIRHAPFLLTTRNIQGYRQVTFKYRGAYLTTRVHRLVAAAFIRLPRSGEVVNHINAKRADNRVENLEWTTAAGNARHTAKMGRNPRGLAHFRGKIDHIKAFKMFDDGASYAEIAKMFNSTRQAAKQMIARAKKSGVYNFRNKTEQSGVHFRSEVDTIKLK